VSSILHALNKRSFGGFVAFCECLIKTGQSSIISDFLTPELRDLQQQRQQQQPSLNVAVRQGHVAAEDTASLEIGLLGVVDLRPPEQPESGEDGEEAATSTAAHAAVVDYDWKSLIREKFVQLTQLIDPDSGLLNQLQSRGVISQVSADVIRVRSPAVYCRYMTLVSILVSKFKRCNYLRACCEQVLFLTASVCLSVHLSA